MGVGSRLATLPQPGDEIDRYVVLAEVAHGGMAAVYAVQRRGAPSGFDKVLAMKVLMPHLADERRFVDMFLDEARIAAHVQHPNVVQVFDVGERKGLPFLVMEYLSGQTLSVCVKRAIEDEQQMPPEIVFAALAKAAHGLHAAHEATDRNGAPLGIVHRDVSPQNVHVGYDGHTKVVDFGIAAARGRITSTRTGELKGKVAFLAPEQIDRSQPIDRRTDLWAFATMAYEILGGIRLFRADDDATTMWNILHKSVPDLATIVPSIPAPVAEVLAACLRRRVHERPTNALEVARAFESAGVARDSEIGDWMRTHFAAERAREEERIAAAVRTGPAPPLAEPESSSGRVAIVEADAATLATSSGTRRDDGARMRWPLALGAIIVLGVAGYFGWRAIDASPNDDASTPSIAATTARAPEQTPRPDPTPESPPAREAPPRTTIEVGVAPDVRLVLVDGVRADDRPIRIALRDDGRADVELVTRDGTIVRRALGPEDDGQVLGATGTTTRAGARTSQPRARSREHQPVDSTSTDRPLMHNPY